MKIMLIIIALFLCYVIWQRQELKKFRIAHYTVVSERIHKPVKLLVAADFHCHIYGEGNKKLTTAVEEINPDLILVPGDMIVSAHTEDYPAALSFFKELIKAAPVYFSNGNHESRVEQPESLYFEEYMEYKRQVEELGVHILNNEKEQVECKENSLMLYGLDIPLDCYTKGKIVPLPENFLNDALGEADSEKFSVLLAHNPLFCDDYAAWGADLTVAGHTHGGLIRLPGIGSVISPQFQLFPKYDSGFFTIGKRHAVVSRGLGTHTFHIRIFDRAELVVIHLKPEK